MVVITYITQCMTAELEKKIIFQQAGKPQFKSKKYKHASHA